MNTILTWLDLGVAAGVIPAILIGLHIALKRARWLAADRRRLLAITGGLLLAWLLSAVWLSWSGFFQGGRNRIPTLQYGIFVPLIAGILLFRNWPLLRRAAQAIPQQWLVGIQLYRALGVTFLALYILGELPAGFALPAGIGDVMVGLLAPVIALRFFSRPGGEGFVRAWNLAGIADLVVAVTTGFLSSPSPLQAFAFDAPNRLISVFPLALIPSFLVPLSVLIHLLSLRRLRHENDGVRLGAVLSGQLG